jgi:hypothetical protein
VINVKILAALVGVALLASVTPSAQAGQIQPVTIPCTVKWAVSVDPATDQPVSHYQQLTAEAFSRWQGLANEEGLAVSFQQEAPIPLSELQVNEVGTLQSDRDDLISVAFVEPAAAPPALAGTLGQGGFSYKTKRNGEKEWTFGHVSLSIDEHRDRPELSIKITMLHEIGHALSLAHVDDPEDIMHALNYAQSGFTAGNREDIRAAFRECKPRSQTSALTAQTLKECEIAKKRVKQARKKEARKATIRSLKRDRYTACTPLRAAKAEYERTVKAEPKIAKGLAGPGRLAAPMGYDEKFLITEVTTPVPGLVIQRGTGVDTGNRMMAFYTDHPFFGVGGGGVDDQILTPVGGGPVDELTQFRRNGEDKRGFPVYEVFVPNVQDWVRIA